MSDPRFRRPTDVAAERARWRGRPRVRPDAPVRPGPGQESVWDYPRPPRLERLARTVEVHAAGGVIAHTRTPFRVCETAGPPVYYVPASDVDPAALAPSAQESFCEWKGLARYWDLALPAAARANVAWSYPAPDPGYEALADAVAFYPARVACFVDGERVRPQPGSFYGGWITDEIVGPFKGEPGSEAW